MTADPFTDRLARVRDRFAMTLIRKIEETCAAIPRLSSFAPSADIAVGQAYRCVHGIAGVGPTVGFPASGDAARNVEKVMRTAQRERRGLTADEITLLTKMLRVLREVASRELRPFQDSGRETVESKKVGQ
jgi:chemotaxis protein histidine kinase CheA